MSYKTAAIALFAVTCFFAGGSHAQQYPLMDRIAEKVVQKYQNSSCEQLAAERSHHASGRREEMEERLVRLLHEDPVMRREFIGRIAAPIANKLFECGMIP
jgi:hypothetical protein